MNFLSDDEEQDSPLLAVLKHYGDPLTRDAYIEVSYLGHVSPDEEIPAAVERTFPRQFRRETLNAPMLTRGVQ